MNEYEAQIIDGELEVPSSLWRRFTRRDARVLCDRAGSCAVSSRGATCRRDVRR
jgi:hypothetical protein